MLDLTQVTLLVVSPLAGLLGQIQAERVARLEGIAVECIQQKRVLSVLLGLGVAVWACRLPGEAMLSACILGWLLCAVVAVDTATMLLPRSLTVSLIATGLLATWVQRPEYFGLHAIGAAAGWASFRAVAFAYHLTRGRPGLGLGDAMLLAGAGAWVGPEALPGLVFLAAGSALVFAAGRQLAGRDLTLDHPMPFGPSLALATWVTWAIGPLQLG